MTLQLRPIRAARVATATPLHMRIAQVGAAIGVLVLLLAWGHQVDTTAADEDARFAEAFEQGRLQGRQETAQSAASAWSQGYSAGSREAAARASACRPSKVSQL